MASLAALPRDNPPTISDVEGGVRSIVRRFDPCMVLLYGSIHLGTATPSSDVDLCVILNDLDYHQREATRIAVEELVEATTGWPADARITDWPEWLGMSRCVSTFERYIKDHSQVVYERKPKDVIWGKTLPVTPTDPHLALNALLMVLAHIERLAEANQRRRGMRGQSEAWNHLTNEVSAVAQDVMEQSLVALHRAIPVPLPPRASSVRHLIEMVAPTKQCHIALVAALGFAEPEKAPSLSGLVTDGACRPPRGDTDALVTAAHSMASICAGETVGLCKGWTPIRRANKRIQRLVRAAGS